MIKNFQNCLNFKIPMNFIITEIKCDGGFWRCKYCKKTLSIRFNSVFEIYKMPLKKIMKLIIGFSYKYPITELSFRNGLSRPFISDIFIF